VTVPDVGAINVDMILMSVVLPAPLGPKSAINSSFYTLRLTLLSATLLPKTFDNPLIEIISATSSLIEIALLIN